MKEIEIDGKKYNISCTAYTRLLYKKTFGVGIFEDINIINNFNSMSSQKQEEMKKEGKTEKEISNAVNTMMMEKLDDFMDVIQRISYIEILTADPKVGTYEEWLSKIENIKLSDPWIAEVTEYAVTSFCG